MKKLKILVAMSGGVDSSVAAALLLKQEYEMTGAFMVNYDENGCWRSDYQDAIRVAAKLGIKLLRLDFTKEYKKLVLDYMFKEYKAARTPNPDVMCNKFIKFGVWLKKAKELGFDKLATGHYANIKTLKHKNIKTYCLMCAKDSNKDQTYFLHQLTQKQLKNVLFPLGDYTKSEVRKLAKKFGLPTADKEESMGICFIGEVNMKDFLKEKIKTKIGDVVMSSVGANCCSPAAIGKHDGLAFYTIGQRCHPDPDVTSGEGSLKRSKRDSSTLRSLYSAEAGCAVRNDNTKPLFVVDKNIKKNQLIAGFGDDPLLYKKQISVISVNWISGHSPKFPLKCEVRLRHRQPLQKCIIKKTKKQKNKKTLAVVFDQSQRAVTPGQFAVFYLKGECLGGGVIS